MPKSCSLDLRERVLDAVETGASRREAAERFEVSASSAVKWMQRWHETGSVAAKWPARAGVGCASKACLTRPGWCSSMKPQPQPTWYGFEAAADAVSG